MKKLFVVFIVFLVVLCNYSGVESSSFDSKSLNIKYGDIDIQAFVQHVRDSAEVDTNFFITEDVKSFSAVYHQGDSIFSLYIDDSVITQEFECVNRDLSITARENDMDKFIPFPFWKKFI